MLQQLVGQTLIDRMRSDRTCMQSVTTSSLSLGSTEFVLSVFLPGIFIILTAIYDFLSAFSNSYPKAIRTVLSSIASPFRNFLTLEDLEDIDSPLPRPIWKTRALVSLALVNAVGWLAYFAYAAMKMELAPLLEAVIASAAWVRTSLPSPNSF